MIATWIALHGEESSVNDALLRLAESTRREPGCRAYHVCREVDDPKRFVIFELYDDEQAFKAHAESPHFAEHALGDGIPRLSERSRLFLSTVTDTGDAPATDER